MRWCVVLLLSLAAFPPAALAYRTFADLPDLTEADGQRIAWAELPIAFEVYDGDEGPLDAEATSEALDRAIVGWNAAMCTQDVFEPSVITELAASHDGYNTVQWVSSGWSALGDDTAVAFTQPVYEIDGGRYTLIEADIFLNADTVTWTEDLIGHLDGVLMHELGHALGLAHPCEADGGQGAPRCEDDAMSLMHPLYDPSRASLTSDDEEGACFLYGERPAVDEPPTETGGCAVRRVAPIDARSSVLAMSLALLGLTLRRRQRVRR